MYVRTPAPPVEPDIAAIIEDELSALDIISGAGAHTRRAEKTPAQAEVEKDWRTWLTTLFPQYFQHDFAPHHISYWDWVWSLEYDTYASPFVSIWSRGHGKSTSAELACAMLGAKGARVYILYVCRTQDAADKHVATIGALLESDAIRRYYPELGERLINKYGHSKGWKCNRLRTATGFTVDALGLDSAARGIKIEEFRPDLIIFDDIDGKHDSPLVTAKIEEIITSSILPCGSMNATTLFCQNLIHKDSIASRLADPKRADYLADRIISGPHPAIRNLEYIQEPSGKWTITNGVPTWAGMDLSVAQRWLTKLGLAAFLMELQHEVHTAIAGAIFKEYNELYHVITRSEFVRVFGGAALERPDLVNYPDQYEKHWRMPALFNFGIGFDWGATPGHPSVAEWAGRPAENQPLSDCFFLFREICAPEFPLTNQDYIPPTPMRFAAAIREAQKPHNEVPRTHVMEMSHEASAVLNTFLFDAPAGEDPLYFQKKKGNRQDGIPQIQNLLQIDYTKPHPFRRYPSGHELAGQPIMGRPRFYIVVPDNQGDLYLDVEGKVCVRSWENAAGMARLRWEFPRYCNPVNKAGVEAPHPKYKHDDDAIDAIKYLFAIFGPYSEPLSAEERREGVLPDNLKQDRIMQLPEGERAGAFAARQRELQRVETEQAAQVYSPTIRRRNMMRRGGR